jgi:hypothetical protein
VLQVNLRSGKTLHIQIRIILAIEVSLPQYTTVALLEFLPQLVITRLFLRRRGTLCQDEQVYPQYGIHPFHGGLSPESSAIDDVRISL